MKVFLGGTCNQSTWRQELISLIDIEHFNPVQATWTDEGFQRELVEREECDFLLYTITPKMRGVYSIAEVVDDSSKRPDKTLLVILRDYDNSQFDHQQWKSLEAVAKLVTSNGARVYFDLPSIADFINKTSIERK